MLSCHKKFKQINLEGIVLSVYIFKKLDKWEIKIMMQKHIKWVKDSHHDFFFVY